MPVIEHDLEDVAMDVDRMETAASPEHAQADDVAFLDADRLGLGEGLPVDREIVEDVARNAALAQFVGPGRSPFREHQDIIRSEEHTSELQSLMRISYAVFCLKKTKLLTQIK